MSKDFTSNKVAGSNAITRAEVIFENGIIEEVEILDSGYNYVHNTQAEVLKNGVVVSGGILSAQGQGKSSGFWSTYNSHLNGYTNVNGKLKYYNSDKYIQDSNYYQEYSYEIQSKLNIENYEESLKEITHVAGTKVFAKFNLEEFISTPISTKVVINRSEE